MNTEPLSPLTSLSRPTASIDEIMTLLGAPSLLPGEKAEAYWEIYGRLRASAAPKDMADEFLLRDVMDITWDIARYRSAKIGLLKRGATNRALKALQDLEPDIDHFHRLLSAYRNAEPKGTKELESMLALVNVDMSVIEAEAVVLHLGDLERIERRIAEAENRKANMLRELDRRRDLFARRLPNAVIDIESNATELAPPSSTGSAH